jgi:Protein of unknown function (DUF3306)
MAERDRPTRAEGDEGFLRRWSRRKASARAPVASEDPGPAATAPASRQEAPAQEAPAPDVPAPVDPQDLPDIETLDASSDFSVFMRPGVPADLRTLALRKLWRSDPIFAKLDGMVEYGEDYTIASWPKGTIKTAYRVGRGFVKELEKLAGEQAEPEPPGGSAAAEPAPAPGAPAEVAPVASLEEAAPAPAPAGAKASPKRRARPLPRRG